jgi:hypothetical protein
VRAANLVNLSSSCVIADGRGIIELKPTPGEECRLTECHFNLLDLLPDETPHFYIRRRVPRDRDRDARRRFR